MSREVFLIAVVGGLSTAVFLVLFAVLGVWLYCAAAWVHDRIETRRHDADLDTCERIAALPTTDPHRP
ncbi:hypothetical protein ACFWPV_10085 [Streptomyces uncialis]|uniref:hypothetical protein n=1 Tax=Streptomyces uncialis TaxID=1048205 RepID=UPI0036626CFA